MGTKIGSLIIDLALEYGLLKSGLTASEREIAKAAKAIERKGREMADFGKQMSVAVSLPIAGLAVASVKAAKESADALGQVNAALVSMGDASGRTTEQLQALAGEQMRQSLYDDDQILREVTANLLTFGKVSGEQFDRAQQAALDLATRMNGDLKGATIQIGKALNDPIKGVSALSKAGIQFTVDQKAMIASLVETGDVAGAQRIILAELERQFRGSAKAARDADPGAALAQAFANFQEEIGGKLLPLLPAFTDALTGLIDAFSNLPDGAQQAIIVIAGLAAAVGPVAMVLGSIVQASAGTVAMISSLGLSFGGLVTMALPFVAVAATIAAAAYAIYTNWDRIAPVLEGVWTHIQKVLGPPIEKLISGAMNLLTALWEGPLGEMVRTVIDVLGELGAGFASVLGEVVPRVLNAALSIVGTAFEQIGNIFDLFAALLRGDFAGAWEAISNIIETAITGFLRVIVAVFPEITAHVVTLYFGVKKWLQDKLGAVFDWVGKKIEQVKGFFFDLYDAVVGNSYVPDMVDEIGQHMARLDGLMVEPARKAARSTADAMRDMARETQAILAEAFPEEAALFDRSRKLTAFDAAADAEGLSDSARSKGRRNLLGVTPPEISPELRKMLAEVPEQIEMIPIKLGEAAKGTQAATVQIAESMRDMAERSIQALDRMVNAIKGGDFLDILGSAVNLFLQLGSTGLFGKSLQTTINAPRIPGNANGTAFHPGGLMQVGERGPEILQVPRGGRVVPNHELRAASAEAAAARVTVGIDPRNGNITAFVTSQIAESAPAIASGGATIAQGQIAQRARRRYR